MGKLKDFVGCMVNRDLIKMTLNIYEPLLITKMIKLKSLMKFNTSASLHKGIIYNQEIDTIISYNLQKIYRSGIYLLLHPVKHS